MKKYRIQQKIRFVPEYETYSGKYFLVGHRRIVSWAVQMKICPLVWVDVKKFEQYLYHEDAYTHDYGYQQAEELLGLLNE